MQLRAIADSDQLLLDEMLRPPPLEQARRSLEFWQQRRRGLPVYRWNARKEADEMIRRCRERLIAAERLHYGTGLVGLVRRLLAFEPPLWPLAGRALAALLWRALPQRLAFALLATVSAALALTFAVGVVVIALVLQAI